MDVQETCAPAGRATPRGDLDRDIEGGVVADLIAAPFPRLQDARQPGTDNRLNRLVGDTPICFDLMGMFAQHGR